MKPERGLALQMNWISSILVVQSKKEAHEQRDKERFIEPKSVESTSEGAQTEMLVQDSPAQSSERFESILDLPRTCLWMYLTFD